MDFHFISPCGAKLYEACIERSFPCQTAQIRLLSAHKENACRSAGIISGTITDTNHAYNCDNSVFAGFDVKGAARHVIINGEHIVENGSIKLEGRGRYISRTGYMKLR